MKVFHY